MPVKRGGAGNKGSPAPGPDAAKPGVRGAASPAGWVSGREVDELPPFFGRRDRGIQGSTQQGSGFRVQHVALVCDRCSSSPCRRVPSLRTLSAMPGKRPSKKAEPAAFHTKSGRIIKLITVEEILDEQHVQKM